MSKNDKSMEEFDLIKLLLFLLIFLFMCMVMVFFFIVPNVKEYKSAMAAFQSEDSRTQHIYETMVQKQEYEKYLLLENEQIIQAFHTPFSEDSFIEYTKKYFENPTLTRVQNSEFEKEFTQYQLKVEVAIDSPVSFYEFLTELNEYESITKVDFPISMEEKDGKIHTIFNIKVYEIVGLN